MPFVVGIGFRLCIKEGEERSLDGDIKLQSRQNTEQIIAVKKATCIDGM